MNCKEVRRRLLFFIENTLTTKERQAIEQHLSGCSSCRNEYATLFETQSLINQGFQTINAQKTPPWVQVELEQNLAKIKSSRLSYKTRFLSEIKSHSVWQPVWKSFVYGLLIIIIVTCSVLFLPRVLHPSAEVLARQIVSGDQKIEAFVQGEPITQDVEISSNEGYILVEGPSGNYILACFNLSESKITRVLWLGTLVDTEEQEQTINIAKNDSRVLEIINDGFKVTKIKMLPESLNLSLIDDEPRLSINKIFMEIVFKKDNRVYFVRVDPVQEQVVDFKLGQATRPAYPWFHIYPPYTLDKLLQIADKSTSLKRLLDEGAAIISAVAGGEGMEKEGLLIIELENNRWAASIDLVHEVITSIETIPTISWEKEYYS